MKVAVVLALLLASPTSGVAERGPSYCSRSGDLCYGIVRSGGTVSLRITTFARYFPRYRLCVQSPGGATTCRSFPIRRQGRLYGSTVIWYANFPRRGPGLYRVTWRLGAERLGPTLSFRIA
jgi:hypothetical protein